ncbi:GIN domain-containing protein [Gilvimarinus sp. F26214L]|uniref:GIN domain-containing protein n=1 Tax=Gilvimarinus sp. DZF01 TaxID=3461371 RepID=UPI004045CF3C
MTTIQRTIIFALVFLAGATQAEVASTTIDLEGIEHVHLLSRHNLVVTQGEREFVTVTAERKHLKEVEARIKGDVLALGEERSSFWNWAGRDRDWQADIEVQLRNPRSVANRSSGTVTVGPISDVADFALLNQGSGSVTAGTIDAPTVELGVHGSGESRVEGVRAGEATTRVHGSGSLDLASMEAQRNKITIHGSGQVDIRAGATTEMDVVINGSGDLNSAELLSEQVTVSINGSGDALVHASEALDVRINGSGDVRYSGEPKHLGTKVNGSGDVASSH